MEGRPFTLVAGEEVVFPFPLVTWSRSRSSHPYQFVQHSVKPVSQNSGQKLWFIYLEMVDLSTDEECKCGREALFE